MGFLEDQEIAFWRERSERNEATIELLTRAAIEDAKKGKARIAELEAALKPFADAIAIIPARVPVNDPVILEYTGEVICLVHQFEQARRALRGNDV